MKAFLSALLLIATGTPTFAQQHQGHTEEQQSGSDAETSAPPSSPSVPADPHAAHAEPRAAPAPAADDHAEHTEPAAPTEPADAHANHDPAASEPDAEAPPPAAAFEGPRHAADQVFDPSAMAAAREQLRAEQGSMRTYQLLADQLEARRSDGRGAYLWDAQGWYGGDINKLWIKTEGEDPFGEESEQAEVQALWSRAVTPWFNFQAGVRYDLEPAPERRHLVVGMQGLVPYFFEIDGAAFLSDEGDVTARFEAEYDQFITQRLILQPRIELDLSAQDIPELGIGSGLSSAELGLRLRYEFARELAPYVGIEYERAVGGTADFARAAGEDVRGWSVVLGVRAWF